MKEISPPIWRRFVVPSYILLPELHQMLQNIMGWTNSHLHQFIKDDQFYCKPDPEDEMDSIDYRKIGLDQLVQNIGDEIIYEYDFGDGWEHIITLEEIQNVPYCIEGERSCPPEDCGSYSGYDRLIEILKDPTHEEYDDYLTWLGGSFDPEFFNQKEINERLLKKYYGMPYLYD